MKELSELELELYTVIDDIDTASDVFKENFEAYQNYVMNRIRAYHNKKLTTADGYKVWRTK